MDLINNKEWGQSKEVGVFYFFYFILDVDKFCLYVSYWDCNSFLCREYYSMDFLCHVLVIQNLMLSFSSLR